MTIKPYNKLFLLSVLGFVAPHVYADDAEPALDIEAITNKWKCKYCPEVEDPWTGSLGIGAGYVTNDSYKLGEYSGLSEKGGYLDLDLDVHYRNEDGYYMNAETNNLGLDSTFLNIENGLQGTFKIKFGYDQISRYQLDTARTPYSGGSYQTLPAGWVNASSTAGFTTLNNDLHDVNISTERRTVSLGGEYILSPAWSFGIDIRQQTKEGTLPTGFGFGFDRSAIFARPIDYTTDDLELSINYRSTNFSGKLAFINSNFKNDNKAFRWENAFDAPNGNDEGQAGDAPDNSKQQFLISGNYSGFKDWQLNALFSVSELSQDEAYLPYTVNQTLLVSTLPTNSLHGKVQVYNTNLAAHWLYSPKQQWHFVFEHHEQDNTTPRFTYTYVTGDNSVTTTPRANFPYGFQTQKLKVYTDYTTDSKMKLSGGGQISIIERSYQSVDESQENTLWAKLKDRIDNSLEYSIRAELSDRSADSYSVVTELVPTDNPLMRKYNMADRSGQKVAFNLSYTASENLLFNFSSDLASYDYDASQIGLTESEEFTLGVDIQYIVDEDLSFTGFIQNTDISSTQAGSQSFTTADWFASVDDNFVTLGLGFNYQIIENKFKVGMDVSRAESTSSIDINTGSPLPDLETSRTSWHLYGDYLVNKNLTVRASYAYEDYKETNWSIDNVDPNTIAEVLTLGERAPDYGVGIVWLGLKYKF